VDIVASDPPPVCPSFASCVDSFASSVTAFSIVLSPGAIVDKVFPVLVLKSRLYFASEETIVFASDVVTIFPSTDDDNSAVFTELVETADTLLLKIIVSDPSVIPPVATLDWLWLVCNKEDGLLVASGIAVVISLCSVVVSSCLTEENCCPGSSVVISPDCVDDVSSSAVPIFSGPIDENPFPA